LLTVCQSMIDKVILQNKTRRNICRFIKILIKEKKQVLQDQNQKVQYQPKLIKT
jgi:hypothetical protein